MEVTVVNNISLLFLLPCYLLLCHVALVNGMIWILFNLRMGMTILSKDPKTGQIPLISYLLFPGFFLPCYLYTAISKMQDKKKGIAAANEILPGWWIGGRHCDELERKWSGTIDMTCEFPESCADTTERYLLLPCWDGVPPTPDLLERAANFAVEARANGDVMVHCAHGRGRSTCVMCACLVRAGAFPTWQAALEACKEKRSCVKLNRSMRAALDAWQADYVEKQK